MWRIQISDILHELRLWDYVSDTIDKLKCGDTSEWETKDRPGPLISLLKQWPEWNVELELLLVISFGACIHLVSRKHPSSLLIRQSYEAQSQVLQ